MHKTIHEQKEVQVGMHTRDKKERTHPRAAGRVWLSTSGFTGNNALVIHLYSMPNVSCYLYARQILWPTMGSDVMILCGMVW